MSLLPGALRAKHQKPRARHDWYTESTWASEQLFAQLELEGPVHDPFCGEGRIVKAARAAGYVATGADIIDRGFAGVELIDFFSDWRSRTTLVFNPAYCDQERAIAHALRVAQLAVVVLARIPFLCGQARHWTLYQPYPPSLVLACSERVNCPPGGIGAPEEGGTADYGWLIWSRDRPRWRCCGGILAEPGRWWSSPDGTVLDWLQPGLRMPRKLSAA